MVGRLGRPHGLDGHLGLYVDPEGLVYFEPGSVLIVGDRRLTVRSLRRGKKGHQVEFEEIQDRDAADEIRGTEVLAPSRRPLAENEFWPEDLVGLEVRPAGGVVVGVQHGVGQDRLVIERDDIRFEVPFVDAFVPSVDVSEGYVEIVEIEGLSEPPDRP